MAIYKQEKIYKEILIAVNNCYQRESDKSVAIDKIRAALDHARADCWSVSGLESALNNLFGYKVA